MPDKTKNPRIVYSGFFVGAGGLRKPRIYKSPAGAFFPAGLFGGAMLFESTLGYAL